MSGLRLSRANGPRPAHRTIASAIALAVGAGALSGCARTEATGPGAEVLAALAEARYEETPPTGVTYVDAERARELLAEDAERFDFVARLGTPLLGLATLPEHRYGLDPERASRTVTVGFGAPYGVWDGEFDAAAIVEDLAADGFTERETEAGTVWVNHDRGLGLLVTDERIHWGDEQLDPARTAESGEPVAERDAYRDLGACLGDVYRADFVETREGSEVAAYAFGHRAESATETSTVLCAVTGSDATADEAAERLRETVADRPDRYADAEVERLDQDSPGVVVTIPDQPEQRPGWLLVDDFQLVLALTGS
ncbi:hypothetical protein [Streptomyces profundus]|uniref:hypothetical protein n=1 Tax=Streptomyces profundus TaxID=2867410 RepID=UPI001D162B4D|nr:hypothetical protein [Streptomyces sp. MA3_2.13]UED86538.1 hypothetical protein K4G22_22025 [Streptomyces sp. MA3_2.13]